MAIVEDAATTLDEIGSKERWSLVGAAPAFIYFLEPPMALAVVASKPMNNLLHRFCLMFHFAAPAVVVAQGPIHFWPLDETSGTLASDLNGGANGTLVNGPTWAVGNGYLGGGAEFDGVDDRIDLGPVDITTGTGLSIACWLRPGGTSMQDQLLVGKAYDPLAGDFIWSLGTTLHTCVRFQLQTAGTTTVITSPPNSIFPGAFYHLAATYDGTEMLVYVNGALAASANKSGAMGFHPQALASMGHLNIGPGVVPFSGIIGDVRIWDRGLSQSEVFDLVLEQDISLNAGSPLPPLSQPIGPTRLFDPSGRSVRVFSNAPTALQTDDLPPGLYVLQWYDGDRVRSARWMKP